MKCSRRLVTCTWEGRAAIVREHTCCIAATRASRLPWLCRGAEWSTNGSLVFSSAVSLWGVATSTVFESVAMTGKGVSAAVGRGLYKSVRWCIARWKWEVESDILD